MLVLQSSTRQEVQPPSVNVSLQQHGHCRRPHTNRGLAKTGREDGIGCLYHRSGTAQFLQLLSKLKWIGWADGWQGYVSSLRLSSRMEGVCHLLVASEFTFSIGSSFERMVVFNFASELKRFSVVASGNTTFLINLHLCYFFNLTAILKQVS
jgi:hypothetical protein